MLPRFGIRGKLFVSILLILLLSYSALIYTTIKNLYSSLEEDIKKDLETNLKFVQSQYLDRADLIKYSLLQPASSDFIQEDLQARDKGWLRNSLKRCQANLPFVDVLTIVDRENRVVARAFNDSAGDGFELAGVVERAFRDRQPSVSTELAPYAFLCHEGETKYCFPPANDEAVMMTVVVPLLSPRGDLLGAVIAGDIINNYLLPFKVSEIFGKKVEVAITQGGNRIASSQAEGALLPATIAPEILAKLEKGHPYRGEAVIGEEPYETAFEPIKNLRGDFIGSFSVALSKESVKKIRHNNLRNILASVALGIILSFGLAFIVARKLSGPLRDLARGAHLIETGDLSHRVRIDQRDELGMLANSFNSMADALLERDRLIRVHTGDLQELNEQLEKKVVARTAELRMEMGRLEAILTSMAEGVVVTDHDNLVILCNPAAQKLFDLVPHRILNQPVEELCKVGDFCALVGFISKMREENDLTVLREEEIFIKGKKLKFNIAPLLDEKGEFAGVVMSIRDATMEEEVDRMKTEFISTVSHELKTPLTSMKGSLQYIMTRGKWPTDMERELLMVCLRNTDRLIRLINDILDISKIEAGKVEITLKPQKVDELVNYALEEINCFAMNRNVSIENNAGSALPQVYGDHDRLIQVLTNLLSNAVKFSPEGKDVLVSAQRDGNYVAISVADHGNPIQWSDRDKLFKKFQQLPTIGEVAGGGTGLGLAICKEIIELHHGRIFYRESDAGGNVFTFTVPVFEEF